MQVQDNGSGIAEEDLDHVFDPFFTKKEVGAGMGLGLSICHRILESHDGRIEVESDPGRSTVFSVFIPQPWQGLPDGEDLAGTVRGAPPEGPPERAEGAAPQIAEAGGYKQRPAHQPPEQGGRRGVRRETVGIGECFKVRHPRPIEFHECCVCSAPTASQS